MQIRCGWNRAALAATLATTIAGCADRTGEVTEDSSTRGPSSDEASSANLTGHMTTEGQGTTDTGEPPPVPECPTPVCGDGIVGLDEACDDANAVDGDGCSADCLRNAHTVSATAEHRVADAVVDADGSIVLVGGTPTKVTRIAPDGAEFWSTALATPHESVRVVALHVGTEIVVVADGPDSNFGTGSIWRFGLDGSPRGRIDDASDRYYVDAILEPSGDMFLLTGSGQWSGFAVERQTSDGSPVWQLDVAEEGTLSLGSIALVADDVLLGVGGVSEPWQAAIARIEPEGVTTTMLSETDYPNTTLGSVTPDGEGGAFASGSGSGGSIAVRIDSVGEVRWISSCSSSAGFARVVVVDDRIVLYGQRYKPEPNCGDVCSGAHWAWVQHLGFDGTVLAADTLVTDEEYPYDTAYAIRRNDTGELTVISGSNSGSTFVAQLPW